MSETEQVLRCTLFAKRKDTKINILRSFEKIFLYDIFLISEITQILTNHTLDFNFILVSLFEESDVETTLLEVVLSKQMFVKSKCIFLLLYPCCKVSFLFLFCMIVCNFVCHEMAGYKIEATRQNTKKKRVRQHNR